ncbi:MAG: calcium/sodium antiporter [Acidobacteria bacterium]|nr:calcium/sodium antiporter [Acidobacteriota bacterium]
MSRAIELAKIKGHMDSTLAALLWLVGGLAALLAGAKYFVEGIAEIARAFGVSPLIIGMTVVAFGTSTPELVINALSAHRGETALAFGNIVGSCTVNIGFVLGLTALIQPLKVESSLITREIPMLWVAMAGFLILGNDAWLSGAATDAFQRTDGLVLLLLFGIFIYYTAIYSIAQRRLAGLGPSQEDAFMEEVGAEAAAAKPPSGLKTYGGALLGLAGVSAGAAWAVDGATALARLWGMSENLIGLTIVSLGTTLPELVTCVMAARRGDAGIALGNVVGSNLFNILAIGGTVATLRPVSVPGGGHWDLLFMAALSAVLLPLAIRSGQRITRAEGAFLLASYLAFLGWRLLGSV